MTFQETRIVEENKPMQTTVLSSNPESQDYWYYCSHTYKPADTVNNDKEVSKYQYHKDKKHDKKMDTLVCNSYEMLNLYFDPKLYPNDQLPYDLFQTCKGIMFLRIWKGGIVLGGFGGTGIVMAHQNGTWSYPCAVSVGGVQFGLQLGLERVDDVLLLRDDAALRLFVDKGHFKLGMDASVAVGKFGRDSNTGITMSGGESKSIYSYSFAKGAFIGLLLDGGVLTIDNSVNEEFYGRKIGVKDILYGNNVVPQNNDFMRLQQLLNSFSLHQQKIINEPSNVHDVINPVINQ